MTTPNLFHLWTENENQRGKPNVWEFQDPKIELPYRILSHIWWVIQTKPQMAQLDLVLLLLWRLFSNYTARPLWLIVTREKHHDMENLDPLQKIAF